MNEKLDKGFRPKLSKAYGGWDESDRADARQAQALLKIHDIGRPITIPFVAKAAFWLGEIAEPEVPVLVGGANDATSLRYDGVWFFGTTNTDILRSAKSTQLQEYVKEVAEFRADSAMTAVLALHEFIFATKRVETNY